MRILFWVLLVDFVLFGSIALRLYNLDEAGMVMIYFLPVSALSIMSGLGAGALSRFKADSLSAFEKRAGEVTGITALIALAMLVIRIMGSQ